LIFVNNFYFADFDNYDKAGDKFPDSSVHAFVEVPILLWAPGVKLLGGNYALGIAQPLVRTSAGSAFSSLVGSGAGEWGFFNTILIPGQISWALPNNLFIKAGLMVGLSNGSTNIKDALKGDLHKGGLPTSNAYSTLIPQFGISWLKDGWNLSAEIDVSIPLEATETDMAGGAKYYYKSTQTLMADFTAAKTLDNNWTFGLGAHLQTDLGHDRNRINDVRQETHRTLNFGFGPLVAYDFDNGVQLLAVYQHDFKVKNDVGGEIVNFRLVVPF